MHLSPFATTPMRPSSVILALLTLALAASTSPAQQREVDVLIAGGRVVDGTGSAPRMADVGIDGDRIVFIGDARASGITAVRRIDATGLVVAPGFIDPHTHSSGDLSDERTKANEHYLLQGVTTVLTGNDGGGPVEIGRALALWEQQGIGTNAALFIGQGSVRREVLGMSDAHPDAAQLDRMRALVAQAMREGAIGLSAGLYYAPGSFATTEEVIELARVAAQHGGVYDTHMRDESSYTIGLLGSIAETIRIGREARIPVNISHIKALGTDVWGKSDSVIALVRAARAEGLRVTADQYPYTASGTGLGAALLPRWAEAGGRDSLRARVADPATRARLVADMRDNLRRRGGPESLLITGGDTALRGRTLGQIASARAQAPIETAIQIILDTNPGVASFNMNELDIERFMIEEWVMTGSDGSAGHPRKFGTYPRKLRMYVREKPLLTLQAFVQRSSSLPAGTFGLTDRGVLREGAFADVIVFDDRTFTDRSTYQEPRLAAMGMRWVFVNGASSIEEGTYTGALGGRALRRGTGIR
ncbi:MAG TPA: amidohydrolase family protein [Gemmatimonadaceae bacterium]|nr:amidohydrolase family protein [Gemmatimonadaceae bacterium]